MTIACAVHESPTSYALATDSDGVIDGLRIPNPKAALVGPWIVAGSDSLAQMQRAFAWLVKEGLGPDEYTDGPRHAVASALVRLHAHLLSTAGPPATDHVPASGCVLLLVGPAGIVTMDQAGAIVWHDHYAAIGAGAPVALGALYAMQEEGFPLTVSLVRRAVNAALRWSCDCHGRAVVLVGEP